MATYQETIDTLEQANKDLEEKLALLKEASKTNNCLCSTYKLPKYSVDRAGLDYWINDAKAAVLAKSLDGKDAANFGPSGE